jgi:trehalose 6-phosphate phosphatase
LGKTHLFTEWQKLAVKIARAKRIVLFLDYDGTLTPIRPTPQQARLASPARQVLRKLGSCKGVFITIVSGRSLREVRNCVRVSGIYYAGNHGMEIAGPGVFFVQPQAKAAKPLMRKIKRSLQRGLAGMEGVWVEDKGLTLTIHFRQASRSIAGEIEATVRAIVQRLLRQKRIRLTTGKKVLEIRPPVRWNKGSYVRWYLKRLNASKDGPIFSLCIGDDVTDEDAFRAIRRGGVAVRVGTNLRGSLATRMLRSPREVHTLLRRIDKLRS